MRAFPHTEEFIRAARRIIWFEEPSAALSDPYRFVAYAMRYATPEDMGLIIDHVGEAGLREALDNAPPGVVDARSWAYWNARVGRVPAPPLPVRKFPDPER